jgi:hypothetical protein
VPEVTVVFEALLDGAVGGQARYTQSVLTDASGNATVRLIPGTVRQTRDYRVQALPPARSKSASRCLAAYAVAAVVTEAPRVGAPIKLSRRVSLDGRLWRAGGQPAGSVRVRAIPEAAGGTKTVWDCWPWRRRRRPPARTAVTSCCSTPASTAWKYEPGAGAPLPMAVESGVSLLVSRAHAYSLPAAVLVEGRVVSPEGEPVPDAEVKAFAPGPDGPRGPPGLRHQRRGRVGPAGVAPLKSEIFGPGKRLTTAGPPRRVSASEPTGAPAVEPACLSSGARAGGASERPRDDTVSATSKSTELNTPSGPRAAVAASASANQESGRTGGSCRWWR